MKKLLLFVIIICSVAPQGLSLALNIPGYQIMSVLTFHQRLWFQEFPKGLKN